MNINEKMHGFTVTNIREIKEAGGRLVEMEHDATGAGLVWIDNGSENKLFSVGFKTTPEDSTGVFHILEHSVLCGSEKYPVKEPFVELLKTSMNTFLNAMTYQDKTVYPVSSKMEQDYLNLTGVYLDAVFRPSILTNSNIFCQEGWHIDTDADEPYYKGVVFNEMKGAMSDVDQIAERGMLALLFPDNCYGFNSGGEPSVIPDLTYEKFIETYRRYYHPSNAYFYLDGDVPLEKTLEMIDSYIGESGRLADLPQIAEQKPFRADAAEKYPVSGEDDKAVIVFGRLLGTWADRDKLLALEILTEQLADSNESPLKRAVLSAGLAEDMELYIADGIAQPYLILLFRGVDPSALGAEAEGLSYEDAVRLAGDRLLEITEGTITGLTAKGLPERDLQAAINQMDFKFRQYPEPQGLYRANAVFNSWLYGGDPALYLRTSEAVAAVRAMVSDGSMEKLASEYLGDAGAYSRLTLLPSPVYEEEQAAAERERVLSIVSAMDDKERAALDKLNSDLAAWQGTPDSDEALATIPQLDISDIDPVPELISTEVSASDGVTMLYHPVTTNGVVYINAYFPIAELGLEELPAAALVTEFLQDLPTEDHDVISLRNEIKMYVGSLSFGLDINARDDDASVCTPCLRARAAVLEENLSHAEDLMIEILTRTKFDDHSLMRELITQIDDEGKRFAVSSGHRLAMYAARSHWSARDAAAEAVNGYSFLQYMHEMASASDEDLDRFADFARGLTKRAVTAEGSFVSVTSTEPVDMSGFTGRLPAGAPRATSASYKTALPERVGIAIPGQVSFAVQAYDIAAAGLRPGGSLSVTANIVSLAHLWNEIRVKGGSYGASMSASRTGSIFCYTYRDPDPARSLGIYRTLPDFIDAFAAAQDGGIDGFIISTIAGTEPLVSPAAKGRAADDFWFSGFTDEDRIRVRGEILSATAQDLACWKDALSKLASDGYVCVVGPRSALTACEDLTILSL